MTKEQTTDKADLSNGIPVINAVSDLTLLNSSPPSDEAEFMAYHRATISDLEREIAEDFDKIVLQPR